MNTVFITGASERLGKRQTEYIQVNIDQAQIHFLSRSNNKQGINMIFKTGISHKINIEELNYFNVNRY